MVFITLTATPHYVLAYHGEDFYQFSIDHILKEEKSILTILHKRLQSVKNLGESIS